MTSSKKLPSANNVQKLAVSEIFGPTFQGEGPSTGQRCIFLRLAGCNMSCSFCDTPYTWDWRNFDKDKEIRIMDPFDVSQEIRKLGAQGDSPSRRLVITGGEPLLQQKGLEDLLRYFKFADWIIEVETAGTVIPATWTRKLVDQFNVSPKLATSGNRKSVRYNRRALKALYYAGANFKFVVTGPEDLEEIREIVQDSKIPKDRVWLMPEGIRAPEILEAGKLVAAEALRHGYNFTTRTHVLLYGNKRGV